MGKTPMNATKVEDLKQTGDKGEDPRAGANVTKEKKSGPKKAAGYQKPAQAPAQESVDSHDSGYF